MDSIHIEILKPLLNDRDKFETLIAEHIVQNHPDFKDDSEKVRQYKTAKMLSYPKELEKYLTALTGDDLEMIINYATQAKLVIHQRKM